LRQYIQFQQLQDCFVSYRTKVEVAVESLRDIAKELHEIEIKCVRQKRHGYVTSGVGSGVLGSSLVAGLVTANPVVGVGMFAGTVLTSVGSLIVLTGREKSRRRQLEEKVTSLLLELEEEFEKCQRNLVSMDGEGGDLEQVRSNLTLARRGREMAGGGARNLDTVTNIINNVISFSQNIRERVNSLPREVQGLLQDGLQQMQYFISPYGATTLISMIRNETSSPSVPPSASLASGTCCAGSAVDCLMTSANTSTQTVSNTVTDSNAASATVNAAASDSAVAANAPKRSFYASCGKLGKVVYTVGAVVSVFELYNSITKAGELSRQLRRLKDSSDLLKYEGAAKEVFGIALDLQVILSTVFGEDQGTS